MTENVRKKSKLEIIIHDSQEAISGLLIADYSAQNKNEALIFIELLTDESLLRDLDAMDKGKDNCVIF